MFHYYSHTFALEFFFNMFSCFLQTETIILPCTINFLAKASKTYFITLYAMRPTEKCKKNFYENIATGNMQNNFYVNEATGNMHNN